VKLVVPPANADIEMENEDKPDPFASQESSQNNKNTIKNPAIDIVSEEMEDLELDENPKPRGRNRKRRLIREDSENSVEPDISEPENSKRQIKDDVMAAFVAKGLKEKETSQASANEEAKQNATPNKPKKKQVPKGKKRVMKEKTTEDANGYTIVEEYSEYEDIPAEELAEQEARREKAKTAKQQTMQQAV
jgi:DNA polymerase delta subunit 3